VFESLLSECVGLTDAEVDERLRTNELRRRELAAERAALVAVAEHRGLHRADGHRSIAGYLRATVNTSSATIARDRRLAELFAEHPVVGDAVVGGRVGVDHALEIARVHTNPRTRPFLATIVEVLVDVAEHSSHRELRDRITSLIALLDQDGAFDDLADAVDGRRANVAETAGSVVVSATGGDPLQAAQLQAIFETFVDAEYRHDLTERRDLFGDDADQHPLPRTGAQRRFDALVAIFAAASASPEGRRLPDTVVNLLVDERSAHEALTRAGITLPDGTQIDLDDHGEVLDEDHLLGDLTAELTGDPTAFLTRRCETATGAPIHPTVVLRALLTGHVRRVVMDSRGVVVDLGTRQRLFTGLARDAALLLAPTCEHPGCELPGRWSQIDHNVGWASGGRTDQANANVECGHHNRHKHRHRWRTRRDARGRAYTIRADGTIVLPVGERPPDLTIDEHTELVRTRLHTLVEHHAGAA
jgi:hypothetical protein